MQGNENPLVQIVMGQIAESDIEDILQQTTASTDLSVLERQRMLIDSGLALGIEATQEWSAQLVSSQVEVIREITRTLNTQLVEAMGDDERTALVNAIREPVVKVVQKYLELIASTMAARFNAEFGIPIPVYLARDRSPEALARLDPGGAFLQVGGLFGFIAAKEPEKLSCGCPVCLRREHLSSAISVPETVKLAQTKYGSLEGAARQYLMFALTDQWKRLEEIEASFGSMDVGPAEHTGGEWKPDKRTNELIMRMFSGGGNH